MAVAKKKVDKPKRKRGRPAYEPNEIDEAKITALAETGCPHRLMSWYMQLDIKTMKKYYPDVFENTNIENKTEMVEYSLFYQAAFLKNVSACIFWLKSHKPEIYAEKANANQDPDLGASLLEELANKLPD